MEMELCMHYIPVGMAEPVHEATGACWCYPTPEEIPGFATHVTRHNAKDTREKWERQGIFREGYNWVWVAGVRANTETYFKPL